MNDDLNQKLRQLTDLLGKEGMPENISGILSMLSNSSNKEPNESKTNEEPAGKHENYAKEEKPERNELQDNIEMISKVKRVMDSLQNTNDPRINLLNAIRPFLNKSRQKKVGSCIKLFQMSHMTRFFTENEKGI